MEVYILDSLLRRITVVDVFESLIWTERMRSSGDFELHIHSTQNNRLIFKPGVKLAMNLSKRIMIVETVLDTTDDEGRRMLKVTGNSLEDVFKHRLLARLVSGDWLPYTKTNVPKVIANAIFHDICVLGTLNAGDIIPGIVESSIYPTDTIGDPSTSITYTPDIQDMYTALKNLCDAYSMGFRIVKEVNTSILHFDVYMGSNRTSSQTTLPAVIFSPDLENLRNTNKLVSSALYKNVAYVYNATDVVLVYLDNVDPLTNGFERRALNVKVDDGLSIAAMTAKGKEELAKNRVISALDGELTANTGYIYEVDYNLGDLVELRDDDGATSQMQVTEQIFVADKEGERSYPTLSINTFITPGAWISWDFNQVWQDLGPTTYWADQP